MTGRAMSWAGIREGLSRNRRELLPMIWVLAVVSIVWESLLFHAGHPHVAINVFWRAGRAVLEGHIPYDAQVDTGSFVDTPSALVFVTPLALLTNHAAQITKSIIDIACLVGGIVLVARLLTGRWVTYTAAVMVLVVVHLNLTTYVLREGNWEPQLVLAFAAFIFFAYRHAWLAAALVLGVSLALKPLLGPLILVLLLKRRWRESSIAVLSALGLNALGYAIAPGSHLFFSEVVPFLMKGQSEGLQSSNLSVPGYLRYIQVPQSMIIVCTAAVLFIVGVLLWRRATAWLKDDRDVVVLIELASLSVLGLLLSFSYSFPHYTIYCLPLMLTVVDDRSSMRTPLFPFAAVMMTGVFTRAPLSLVGELVVVLALARDVPRPTSDPTPTA